MKYLLGIDFGGGASKATLLCENGEVVATHTTEYETFYPKPGYAEQNPGDWVRATCENISGVLKKSNISPEDICAIALDAATHTAIIADEDFNVIRPAIYWTDTRSIKEVEYLKENYGDIIERQALHKVDTIWSLPELLWIKNNEKLPKREESQENKSKDDSNNSTISSSDSTDENKKKHKKILSNSFQNMDTISDDEKQKTVKSI